MVTNIIFKFFNVGISPRLAGHSQHGAHNPLGRFTLPSVNNLKTTD